MSFDHHVEGGEQDLESIFILQAELSEVGAAKLRGESVSHPDSLVSLHGVVGDAHEGVTLDDDSVEEISDVRRHHLQRHAGNNDNKL